jgi:hypothetical protein
MDTPTEPLPAEPLPAEPLPAEPLSAEILPAELPSAELLPTGLVLAGIGELLDRCDHDRGLLGDSERLAVLEQAIRLARRLQSLTAALAAEDPAPV